MSPYLRGSSPRRLRRLFGKGLLPHTSARFEPLNLAEALFGVRPESRAFRDLIEGICGRFKSSAALEVHEKGERPPNWTEPAQSLPRQPSAPHRHCMPNRCGVAP